jgi:hypothetical protein
MIPRDDQVAGGISHAQAPEVDDGAEPAVGEQQVSRCQVIVDPDRRARPNRARSAASQAAVTAAVSTIPCRASMRGPLPANRGRSRGRPPGSRRQATGRRTSARDSPSRSALPERGQEWRPAGAARASVATDAPCPPARRPDGCGAGERPCHQHADTTRCRSPRREPARSEGPATGGNCPASNRPTRPTSVASTATPSGRSSVTIRTW